MRPTARLLEQLLQLRPVLSSDDLQLRFSGRAPFKCRNVALSLGLRCQRDSTTRISSCSSNLIELHDDGNHVEAAGMQSPGWAFLFSYPLGEVGAQTIESTRYCSLLVASMARHRRQRYGQFGRWFHDHLSVKVAAAATTPAPAAAVTQAPRNSGLRGTSN